MSRPPAPAGARAEAAGAFLEAACQRFHRPELIRPDPLQFLPAYPELLDRELVAVVAAGLAYGQVRSILGGVQRVLDVLGPHPAQTLAGGDGVRWAEGLRDFRYRWTTGDEVVSLLRILARMQRRWGSLGTRLAALRAPDDVDIQPALTRWVAEWHAAGLAPDHSMVADPGRGSACKRLHLLLRWMVRCDAVDPGGWTGIPPALLLVPLDVHMHRFGRAFGFTRRRAADLRTARELTAGFHRFAPDDPARYDFALTRMPIHDRVGPAELRRWIRAGAIPPAFAAPSDPLRRAP